MKNLFYLYCIAILFYSCGNNVTIETYRNIPKPDKIVMRFSSPDHNWYHLFYVEIKDKVEIEEFWEATKLMSGPVRQNLQLADFDIYIYLIDESDEVYFKFTHTCIDDNNVYPLNQFYSLENKNLTQYLYSYLKINKLKNFDSVDQEKYMKEVNPSAFDSFSEKDYSRYAPFWLN